MAGIMVMNTIIVIIAIEITTGTETTAEIVTETGMTIMVTVAGINSIQLK